MTQLKFRLLPLCSLLSLACNVTEPGQAIEGQPSTELRAASLLDLAADVGQVRYTITDCDGLLPPLVADRDLEDQLIPGNLAELENDPLDENSAHLFADLFQVVEPGCYDVLVEPLQENGKPSELCAPAHKDDVDVTEGNTTEIFLMIQCEGDDIGAIDAIAAINHEPNLDDVVFTNSKFVCDEAAQVCLTASDPDTDPLEFQIIAPDDCTVSEPTSITGDDSASGIVTCFDVTCEGNGRFDLEARVYDQVHQDGELVRVEDWLASEGYPNESHASLNFWTYVDCNSADECQNGSELLGASPGGDMIVCDDPTDTLCEEDLETLCPENWSLCSLGEHHARNDGWAFPVSSAQPVVGEIYCRSSGAGHYTLGVYDGVTSLSDDAPMNCGFGSSRDSCESSYGCNEAHVSALCCAPNPLCGNGVVDLPEEQCDDSNSDETDDCLNNCTWRIPLGGGIGC